MLQDIPAFINKIIEVKTRELYSFHREKNPHLGNDEKAIKEDILKHLKIKYVGHSMGAMLIPMYIVLMKLQGKKHHLSSCVSLAGCGLNANVNGVIWAYGCILTNLVCRFTEKIQLPESLVMFFVKIMSQFKYIPAVNDLVKYLASLVLGGHPLDKNFVVTKSIKIFQSQSNFGMSSGLVRQYWQSVWHRCYHTFYDKRVPILKKSHHVVLAHVNYLDHFDKIDIPITIFMSVDDNLVRADGSLITFKALYNERPDLADIKVFKGLNHIEFNYMSSQLIKSEVLEALNKP